MGELCSNFSHEKIMKMHKQAPCVLLENGNIRTCPVRLSYPWVFRTQQKKKGNSEGKPGKYGTSALFYPDADLTLMKTEVLKGAQAKWPTAGKPGGQKFKRPWLKQVEDYDGDGYLEGGLFIRCYTERRPPVVNLRMVPILEDDEDGIFPGAWALLELKTIVYDVETEAGRSRGVSFGLQQVMKICSDKRIDGGGGSADPNASFGDVAKSLGEFDPDGAFDDEDVDEADLY